VTRRPLDEDLLPVREALIAAAGREAASILGEAVTAAEAAVSAAEAAAIRQVERARMIAERDAARVAAADWAHVRQRSRTIALRARDQLYRELRANVAREVAALAEQPVYEVLCARIAGTARERLGARAEARRVDHNGVIAQAGGRRIVATLPALADWALDHVLREEAQLLP
jgi:hypothetical protein